MVGIGFIVTTIIFHGGTKEPSEKVVNSLPTTDKTVTDDHAAVIFTLFLFYHERQSTIPVCIWCMNKTKIHGRSRYVNYLIFPLAVQEKIPHLQETMYYILFLNIHLDTSKKK